MLLVALAGTVGPLARAVTVAPAHACCGRKAAHRCHDSQDSEIGQPVIRDTGCCNLNGGRAVITAQWAPPQTEMSVRLALSAEPYLFELRAIAPNAQVSGIQSTRAPPTFPHR